MGYDLSWVSCNEELTKQIDEAHARFGEAVKLRSSSDQDSPEYVEAQLAVEAAYDHLREIDKTYFRANIWWMGYLRDMLRQLGLLDDSIPEEHPFYSTYLHYDEETEQCTETPEEKNKFLQIADSEMPEDERVSGIVLNKLCWNNGDIVTPIEIERALATYDSIEDRDLVELAAAHAALGTAEEREAAIHAMIEADTGKKSTLRSDNFEYITDERANDLIEFTHEFIEYLRGAKENGGFFVY